MSFSFCAWDDYLARALAVPVRLQARLVMGRSRAALVGAGTGRSAILSSKTKTSVVVELQTLARVAVEVFSRVRSFGLLL